MAHMYDVPWSDLSAEELESVFIDVIASHNKYYEYALKSGTAEYSQPLYLQCHERDGDRKCGVLLDLDFAIYTDPLLLLATAPAPTVTLIAEGIEHISALARRRTHPSIPTEQRVRQHTLQYNCEQQIIIHLLLSRASTLEGAQKLSKNVYSPEKTFWELPGPFLPKFLSMRDTWFLPLWRLIGDEYYADLRRPQSERLAGLPCGWQLTQENVNKVILTAVGVDRLTFMTALRVPLPPPTADEVSIKPVFEGLNHIPSIRAFKEAIRDIAAAIKDFNDPALCFPGITPDQLLLERGGPPETGVKGFILDLDPLAEPASLTACAGARHDPRAMRFAAYDLIAGPDTPRIHHPRHALETLFHTLIWFSLCTSVESGGGFETEWRRSWLTESSATLPRDRTSYRYETFVAQRRAFLWNREHALGDMEAWTDDMRQVIDAWTVPLWEMIGEAHFSARWREDEDGFDWETLGGRFTPKRFMDILES
ncbi:hypothetical protein C8R43DRAFT_1212119 [Mycena crocata]|nr:hypothetical protein C8R43DRAFT_1212119 [Mycena crocata]